MKLWRVFSKVLSRSEVSILLDLSAAFDTIDHDTLLTCLSTRFIFTGPVLNRFTIYLLDHFISVKIGSVISECFKLDFGVPQDTVLGPLLFSPISQVNEKFLNDTHT